MSFTTDYEDGRPVSEQPDRVPEGAERIRQLSGRITEKLLDRMRKTASGEMVAFDRLHVRLVIEAELDALVAVLPPPQFKPHDSPSLADRVVRYMAESMAMTEPLEDQEQNWILGHMMTFALQYEQALAASLAVVPSQPQAQEEDTRQSSASKAADMGISASTIVKAASTFFDKGRCSNHAQYNGRYCRHAGPWERWCIHCAGFMLLEDWTRLLHDWSEQDSILQQIAALVDDEHVTGPVDVLTAVKQALDDLRSENVALRDNNRAVKGLFDERALELATLTAAPAPAPSGMIEQLVKQWRAHAEAQRDLAGRPDCLNPIAMGGMADATEARADELEALALSAAPPQVITTQIDQFNSQDADLPRS